MLAELLTIAALTWAAGTIPDVIMSSPGSDVMAWVSEAVAVDEKGALSSSRSHHLDVEGLKAAAAANRREAASINADSADDFEKPCETTVGRHLHQYGSTGSLHELAQSAHAVFSGQITGRQQGFLFGQPGTLFAITVSEIARGDVASGDVVYMFYPFARISTASGLICAQPLGAAVLPQIGDTLLLFPAAPSIGSVPVFQLDPVSQLLVFRAGRAHLPANLSDELTAAATAPAILQQIRAMRLPGGSPVRRHY